MAESIVKFVLSKLTDVGVKKALQLYSVDDQVETVTRQLGWIQAFMKDADKKQITSERQKHWVKEMRDVAYLIEDVIDTFLSEVPLKPQKPTGMMESMNKKLKITKNLPVVHKLVDEITQIKKRMDEIETSRLRFGINTLGEDSGEIKLPIRPPVLPDIDPNVVGFKKDRDNIVKELLDETTKRCSVVSIWGVGGLGKTTLAQKVYNCDDIKTQFELRIWVAISQKFELIDILRKVAKQLQLSIDPSKQSSDFLTEIYGSFRDKKYLIVFDDVWTDELWTQIGAALPNENNGSRVLITTRSSEVAKDADPTCEPYKLGFLTKELSVELFLKKALPNHDPNKSTFNDLCDITDQFVQKCGALPLALVVLGGLLSRKPCNYIAWSKVLQTMSWHANDGKKCSEIIGTSYEDLPFALKSCFLYFAAFPEDRDIDAESLIRMWVAEGFIPQENNKTLEETAESYLEDLVQRSLVQVKSRHFDGSIEHCCIHDLLRDLAIQKAKEDNFLVVYSHPDCDQQSLSRARRVAVHHPDCDKLVMSQNLRTLLCFHGKVMPNCSKQKLLKVVSSNTSLESIDVRMFEGLCQLRYLNLRGNLSEKCTGPDDKYGKRYLKKVLGTMNCIQTLNVDLAICGQTFRTFIFPDCGWNMKTLRHVWTGQTYPELPPSTELSNLQTLSLVTTNESWETRLPHLPNLRTLRLLHQKSCSWMVVANFLDTLKNLISLYVRGSFSGDIFDMRKFSFYQNLQSLTLWFENYEGTPNEMATDVFMLPPHLIYLEIHNCHFQQDIMPVLENLHCLKRLKLLGVNKTNRKMRCSAKGFNQLEQLRLFLITVLEDWEIEKGAMPILKNLDIYGCFKLRVPQGLRHLTNLQKLEWWGVGDEGMADEVRQLCKHVPSLILI
ncbi:putative disease resistance RPP13-like protein 3 isoform X1 [Carex rostrata]